MCQWNHPMAAIVPIRWPESDGKLAVLSRVGGPDPVVGNHPMAETTEFGTIRWPRPQIHIELEGDRGKARFRNAPLSHR